MKPKRLKRVFLIFCFLAVSVLVYSVSISSLMLKRYSPVISAEPNGQFDCIIVLGCGVRDDGTPSNMLMDRILTGVEAFVNGVAPVIIMPGDHGKETYDEVGTMKEYAVALGVPSENIFLDHAGFSTYESMYRAAEIFGVKTAAVVTQEYHLYRSLYDAEAFGIKAVGIPADKHVYMGQSMRDTREIIARNKDFLYCMIRPEPKYLGDSISLKTNGSITEG